VKSPILHVAALQPQSVYPSTDKYASLTKFYDNVASCLYAYFH